MNHCMTLWPKYTYNCVTWVWAVKEIPQSQKFKGKHGTAVYSNTRRTLCYSYTYPRNRKSYSNLPIRRCMDLSRMVRYWIGCLAIARLHLFIYFYLFIYSFFNVDNYRKNCIFRAVDAIEATTTAIEYLKIRVIVCDDPDYLLES